MKWIILIIIIAAGFLLVNRPREIQKESNQVVVKTVYSEPVAEFEQRITKKYFGTYVTPKSSPVKPEKFKGYHTGVDVEYGDVETNVPVLAIAAGEVVYSGRVSGYGGVVIVKHPDFMSLYGHLVPNVKNGENVLKGEQIAILGKAYSMETGGERKHLHLAIIKGQKIDFRGYVQKIDELSGWINPVSLF